MNKDTTVLLTEKEREDVYKYWLHSSTLTNEDGLIQLTERAVLEKLAGMARPEPMGYLCDWGNDSYGLTRQTIYYGEPGSATLDDWNEFPKVHENTEVFTATQLHQAFAQGAASVLSAPK